MAGQWPTAAYPVCFSPGTIDRLCLFREFWGLPGVSEPIPLAAISGRSSLGRMSLAVGWGRHL